MHLFKDPQDGVESLVIPSWVYAIQYRYPYAFLDLKVMNMLFLHFVIFSIESSKNTTFQIRLGATAVWTYNR
jgi:hypothetical protein